MILIATIPAPHQRSFAAVAENEFVKEVRFNTGVSVPDSPKVTLEKILEATRGEKKIWIDLKGRQLRITQWADPTFCHVELSHCIEVELPARIYFRGSHYAQIQEVRGNRLFLHDQPSEALGKGQSVNVHGANLRISGYLTSQDKEYIEAAQSLGLHDYMLSFVEQEFDIIALTNLDRMATATTVKVCSEYEYVGKDAAAVDKHCLVQVVGNKTIVKDLRMPDVATTDYQSGLTKILKDCTPIYKDVAVDFRRQPESAAKEYIALLENEIHASISIASYGPTSNDKRIIRPLC